MGLGADTEGETRVTLAGERCELVDIVVWLDGGVCSCFSAEDLARGTSATVILLP